MVKFPLNNSTIHSDKAEANDSQFSLMLSPLTKSIREIVAFGGLAVVSSGVYAEAHINPNEIWINPGVLKGVCAKDEDQDGDIDLYKVHKEYVALLENTGTPESPQFTSTVPYTNDVGSLNLNLLGLSDCLFFRNTSGQPVATDIDADGDLDLFTSSEPKTNLIIFDFSRNIGTNEHPIYVEQNPQRSFGLPSDASTFLFKDVDYDGDIDFISSANPAPIFYENTGTAEQGFFVQQSEYPLPNCGFIDFLVDLNNDSQHDVLCRTIEPGTFENDKFELIESIGTGYLPRRSLFNFDDSKRFEKLQAIDIDQDGDKDILGASDTRFILYNNIGSSLAPQFNQSRTYLNVPSPYQPKWNHLADLDGDGDLDAIGFNPELYYALNSGTNINPQYQVLINSVELAQCSNSFSELVSVRSENLAISSSFQIKYISLVDIDGDNDLDLFTQLKTGDSSNLTVYCENQGNTSVPMFAQGVASPFGLPDTSGNMLFGDIDGDGDQDLRIDQVFYDNIGNSSQPQFHQISRLPLPPDDDFYWFDNSGDGRIDSTISHFRVSDEGLRMIHDGFTSVTDIQAVITQFDFIIATVRSNLIQIQVCHPRDHYCSDGAGIILNHSAKELKMAAGDLNEDGNEDVVVAIIDSEDKLIIHVYNQKLELISRIQEDNIGHSVSISMGQLDADPADEFVVSYVQEDGKVLAISYNLDGSQVGTVVAEPGKQPVVAVGNFNPLGDSFVLAYINQEDQILTATYQGNGTLISQGNGGKSSYLSISAADVFSDSAGDEYFITTIQEDGKAGLLSFSFDNKLINKVVGNVSQQPTAVSGHFPEANQIGLAASVIQGNKRPAIFFLEKQGTLIGKGVGGITASLATVVVDDINGDGIDEGILVYVDENGIPRWEVFNADGTKK